MLRFDRQLVAKKLDRMLEPFRLTTMFSTELLKSVKLSDYPPIYYADYLNNISFRNIKIRSSNTVKSGSSFSSLLYWVNNLICIGAAIAFTVSFCKNDEDSLYYGNFNGYFSFENKLVLDITTGYILYFTYILKLFYTQFRPDDVEFGWLTIFRLFHKDIDPKQIQLNEKMAGKLWRSTLGLNSLTKVLIQIEVASTVLVYVFVYLNTPDYFKYSYTGFAILLIEFLLIFNIFKTFESFYFMFSIVCKYLAIRTEHVLYKMTKYVHHFERKLNDRFANDESGRTTHTPTTFLADLRAGDLNQDQFEPYEIFELLKEHDSICAQVRRYNFFWRFYLFSVFFTMPMIIGYFVFLLTFDPMNYIHRISLACIILLFISYFYLVTFPAVYLSVKIQKTIHPLKLLNKYRLPIKIKYKIETYLTRFENKVSFNCYEMFDVISETYLDFFFVAGSILFLSLQLFSGNMQYKMSLINGNN